MSNTIAFEIGMLMKGNTMENEIVQVHCICSLTHIPYCTGIKLCVRKRDHGPFLPSYVTQVMNMQYVLELST